MKDRLIEIESNIVTELEGIFGYKSNRSVILENKFDGIGFLPKREILLKERFNDVVNLKFKDSRDKLRNDLHKQSEQQRKIILGDAKEMIEEAFENTGKYMFSDLITPSAKTNKLLNLNELFNFRVFIQEYTYSKIIAENFECQDFRPIIAIISEIKLFKWIDNKLSFGANGIKNNIPNSIIAPEEPPYFKEIFLEPDTYIPLIKEALIKLNLIDIKERWKAEPVRILGVIDSIQVNYNENVFNPNFNVPTLIDIFKKRFSLDHSKRLERKNSKYHNTKKQFHTKLKELILG